MSPRAPEAAVVASTPVTWLFAGANDGLISLGLGLLGVLLARTIFVNRENRVLGHRQPWTDTLPITLAACLIAGGIIWDGHLLYSKAIFTGIAVGWTTIVAIEKISRIVNPGEVGRPAAPAPAAEPDRAKPGLSRSLRKQYPPQVPLPADQKALLRQLPDDPAQE